MVFLSLTARPAVMADASGGDIWRKKKRKGGAASSCLKYPLAQAGF